MVDTSATAALIAENPTTVTQHLQGSGHALTYQVRIEPRPHSAISNRPLYTIVSLPRAHFEDFAVLETAGGTRYVLVSVTWPGQDPTRLEAEAVIPPAWWHPNL